MTRRKNHSLNENKTCRKTSKKTSKQADLEYSACDIYANK